jgi:hypothetical protein
VIEDRLRRPIDEHAIPDGMLEAFVAREQAARDGYDAQGHIRLS